MDLRKNIRQHGQTSTCDEGSHPVNISPKARPAHGLDLAIRRNAPATDGKQQGIGTSANIVPGTPTYSINEETTEDEPDQETNWLAGAHECQPYVSAYTATERIRGDAHCSWQGERYGNALHGTKHDQLDTGSGKAARHHEDRLKEASQQEDLTRTYEVGYGACYDEEAANCKSIDGRWPNG